MAFSPHKPNHTSVSILNESNDAQLQNSNISVVAGNNNIVGEHNVAGNNNVVGDHNLVVGKQTVIIANPTSIPDPTALLLYYCALDALVDAKERFNPPNCAPETRDAILQDIKRWSNSGRWSPSFFWLTGSPGSGKSAICQALAELCKQDGTLLANFFFSRVAGSAGRSNGDRLLPTLIYQTMQNLPEVRQSIEYAIRSNRSILTSTRAALIQTLFCAPLSQFSVRRFFREWFGTPIRLVIIDGLDECQDTDVQCDLLRVISDATSSLAMPLRFVIASRPEAHIKHMFDHHPALRAATMCHVNLDEDQDARLAIFKFVRARVHEIRQKHPLRIHLDTSWPSDEEIEYVVAKSSPQFIFASTVMNYIDFPHDRPDRRLSAIVKMAVSIIEDYDNGGPLENLDRLYRFIFEGVNCKHRSNVQIILAVIYLASQDKYSFPFPTPSPPSVSVLEELLRVLPGMVDAMLSPLSSLLSIPADRDAPIKSLHASLFDFLLDHRRSKNFFINMDDIQAPLLKDFIRTQFRHLQNTHRSCKHLDTTWPSENDIDSLVAKSIPQFVFLSTTISFINSTTERPDASLTTILIGTDLSPEDNDMQIGSLDKLYQFIFSRVDSKYRSIVQILLAIVHLASFEDKAPTPSLVFFEGLFNISHRTLRVVLTPLLSVISVPPSADAPISIPNTTLVNFLIDSRLSRDMAFDLQATRSYLTIRPHFRSVHLFHPFRSQLNPSWPSIDTTRLLASKQSPEFVPIVVSFVTSSHQPVEALNTILSAVNSSSEVFRDARLEDMDRLYRFILTGVNPNYHPTIRVLLAIIHLINEGEFKTLTPSIVFFEELFGFFEYNRTIEIMLAPLASVLSIPSNRNASLQSIYASLFNFLLDHRRAGNLALDLDTTRSYLRIRPQFQRIHKERRWRSRVDPSWPSIEITSLLGSMPSPEFVPIVVKYLSSMRRPNEILEAILAAVDSPPEVSNGVQLRDVDKLYQFIFAKVDGEHQAIVRVLLATVHLDKFKPPLPYTTFKHLLGVSPAALVDMLQPLSSLITIPSIYGTSITPLYTSLKDFLHDPSRAGDMALDIEVARLYFSFRPHFSSIHEANHQSGSGAIDPWWPSVKVIETLSSKSLEFISIMIDYTHHHLQPQEALNAILVATEFSPEGSNKSGPDDIDELYRFIFAGLAAEQFLTIRFILAILYLASNEHIGHSSAFQLKKLFALPHYKMVQDILSPVRFVIELPNNKTHPIRPRYTSLFHFLLDSNRARNLALDLPSARAFLHHQQSRSSKYSQIDDASRYSASWPSLKTMISLTFSEFESTESSEYSDSDIIF